MEKLKHPGTEIDFNPSPHFLLGNFGVYDRDELEDELNKYDPNSASDINTLLDEFFLNGLWVKQWTVQHKIFFMEVFANALKDKDYDFGKVIEDNDDEYFYLPSNWVIKDARLMFWRMYGVLIEKWRNDFNEVDYVPIDKNDF
jgi:hypothetical protein